MATYPLNGPDQPTLTMAQVIEYLHMSESTLRRRIAAGTFPHPHKPGNKLFWYAYEIAAFSVLEDRMYMEEVEEEEEDEDEKTLTPPPKRKPKRLPEKPPEEGIA